MKAKSFLISIVVLIITMSSVAQTGIFTDSRDGKTYKTIIIGKQTWMTKNLAYKTTSGCWAYNNDQSNLATYGYLYVWETLKNVCPSGWHMPTNSEWKALTDYLGGMEVAGSKLKETNTIHWKSPNIGATNESGFTALPGGYRTIDGLFRYIGNIGAWWTSDAYDETYAWSWLLSFDGTDAKNSGKLFKTSGYSVRCVKD